MSNGFVADLIPDDCAENLISAVITDAIFRYARALINVKEYERRATKTDIYYHNQSYLTINEVETFFRGSWFANLAEYLNLNVSGEKLIKLIKKSPKKFCNDHGGRRKKIL